jgi:hypothetical protein
VVEPTAVVARGRDVLLGSIGAHWPEPGAFGVESANRDSWGVATRGVGAVQPSLVRLLDAAEHSVRDPSGIRIAVALGPVGRVQPTWCTGYVVRHGITWIRHTIAGSPGRR